MVPQTIPALVALAFKLALLAYALRAPRRHATTQLFLLLLGAFSLFNIVEIFGFLHLSRHGLDRTTELFGYTYFAVGIGFIALLLHISLRLSVDDWYQGRRYLPFIYVPTVILEVLLVGTDRLVAGFQMFGGYTILRRPGPLYALFETYASLFLIASLAALIYGARNSREPAIARLRNRWWLIALAPFVILNAYLIVANHFGLAKIPSTISLPIALTLFLGITTFATHQHRLFEIEFFLPWSKTRKRKTAFYDRIRGAIAEIADTRSVRDVLQRVADVLACPITLVGAAQSFSVSCRDGRPVDKEGTAAFTPELLESVKHIVLADEISDKDSNIYQLMKSHHIAAIVPFRGHGAANNWLLLGDRFRKEIYTPLDFRVVEQLFDSIGGCFTDRLMTFRRQLHEARTDLREYHHKLTAALASQHRLTQELAALRSENEELRQRNASLLQAQRDERTSKDSTLPDGRSLDEMIAEFEVTIIQDALEHCDGSRAEAARLLRVRPNTLHYKLKRLGIVQKDGE